MYGTPVADLMYTLRRFCCNTLQQISCVPYVVSVATHCNRSRVYYTSFLCDLAHIISHFCCNTLQQIICHFCVTSIDIRHGTYVSIHDI